jgi:hypothetical protein
MPSAAELLTEKRIKAEGQAPTPEEIVNSVIDEVDGRVKGKEDESSRQPEDKEDDLGIEIEEEIQEEDDEDESPDDLEEQELLEAKNLYKALKNPASAGPLIAALAQQMGLRLGNVETKKEEAEVKKDITSRLKEALGDELGFLADKMGPVISQVIEEERESVEEVRLSHETRVIQTEAQRTLNALAKETNGLSRKFEDKMVSLMDKFPSSPELSTDEYIRGIAQIAMGSKLTRVAEAKINSKINKNARDVPSRITSGGGARSEPTTPKVPDKKLGAKGSVLFALGQLQNKDMQQAKNRR